MNRSPGQWICAVVFATIALSAAAAPPLINNHNRLYGNFADGGICNDIPNGYRCRAVQAWENYDVKGTFQFTEVSFSAWSFQSDPVSGGFEESWRTLTCPVDRNAIQANPNHVTVRATLDTSGPGCYQYGERHTWDPVNGDQWFPIAFPPGIREISGDWIDPFSYGSSTWNQRSSNYDGWMGTTDTVTSVCRGNYGDAMTSGGFSVNDRSYAFEGPDGPAWSTFAVSNCNDSMMQR